MFWRSGTSYHRTNSTAAAVENTLTAVEEVERGKAKPRHCRRAALYSTARSTGSRMGALATARPTGLISSRTYETKLLARRTAVLQQYRRCEEVGYFQ